MGNSLKNIQFCLILLCYFVLIQRSQVTMQVFVQNLALKVSLIVHHSLHSSRYKHNVSVKHNRRNVNVKYSSSVRLNNSVKHNSNVRHRLQEKLRLSVKLDKCYKVKHNNHVVLQQHQLE